MKATGIVRRIDDLGRVVIPKEIRRTLHLREGDPLELYLDGKGAVIFQKYTPNNTDEVIAYLVSSARALGFNIGVYDDLGDWRGGSRVGAVNERISVGDESEDLIPVSDSGIHGRAFLFIKVVQIPKEKTLESIKALAQMGAVMLNGE